MVPQTAGDVSATLVRLRRYAWMLVGGWTLLLGASILWNRWQQEVETSELARSYARTGIEKDILYRAWNASRAPVYVPVSEATPPNPHLAGLATRDATTEDGTALTLMNPSYMTRQVHELGRERKASYGHLTSLDPIRPENQPDAWERAALEEFETGIREVSSGEEYRGEAHMRLMRPLLTEENCLPCHADQGYQLGDVRGGISSSVPLAPIERLAAAPFAVLVLCHVVFWFLGLAAVGVGHGRLAGETRLRGVAEKARIAAERKMQRSARLESIGKLAGGIAHEINTPLQFVTSNLQFLIDSSRKILAEAKHPDREAAGDHPDHAELLEEFGAAAGEAKSGVDQVAGLVVALRELTGVCAGDSTTVDLNAVVENARHVAEKMWGDEVRVRAELDPDVPPLPGRAAEISQVLMQILSNAIHAVREAKRGGAGEVTITTRHEEGSVQIEIADNGVGIPLEQQGRIFDPFFRGSEDTESTGLGLTLAYETVVSKHGGQITCRSEPGQGSVFRVRLPLLPVERDDEVLAA